MTQKQENQRMLGALLRIPFQATVSLIYEGLGKKGFSDLRPAHLMVFQHIHPDGSRVTELAELAQITKQSMGSLVDHIVDCGYAKRYPDPNDGRAKIIRLTERGKELDYSAREILSKIEKEWAAHLGNERMIELKQTLHDLIELIER